MNSEMLSFGAVLVMRRNDEMAQSWPSGRDGTSLPIKKSIEEDIWYTLVSSFIDVWVV